MNIVVLLAAGNASRMNLGYNKILADINGKSCILRSVEAFFGFADKMIVVTKYNELDSVKSEISSISPPFPVIYVTGGATRQESVLNGLRAINENDDSIVLIHDGARCFVDKYTISRVLDSVREYGSGVAAVPITDTVKRADGDGKVIETIKRDGLYRVQTPQGFILKDILSASLKAKKEGFTGTDDASVMEYAGFSVVLSQGDRNNIKLTTAEDLGMCDKKQMTDSYSVYSVGHGFDVHRLIKGRKLYLCGIEIPYDMGLDGHSDADVAVHALMDAMLGSAGLGDIGRHFPDTDPAYLGISSITLLKKTVDILKNHHASVTGADITIVAQNPKLSPYIDMMTNKLLDVLSLQPGTVNVKATTTEKLGFEGRGEGISSYAVCMTAREIN